MAEFSECITLADRIARCVLTKTDKSIRDSVFECQCGAVPRKTTKERIAEMDEDQLNALAMIQTMAKEYEGLFAGFTPQERNRPHPVSPPSPNLAMEVETRESFVTRTEERETERIVVKERKKCFKETEPVALCIDALTKTDKSEIAIRAATAACLCGREIGAI